MTKKNYYCAVIGTAKRHIPRGHRYQYIPKWDQQCNKLYDKYNTNYDTDSAVRSLKR
jgi:hypothetical protein